MDQKHVRAVTAWLSSLANTCAGTLPVSDITPKIKEMAPMLAASFPDPQVFTPESKAAMAALLHSFPPFAKLNDFLHAWWLEHRPTLPSGLPDDLANADLNPEDRMGARIWLEHERDNDLPRGELVLRLSVLRRFQVRAFLWLIGHNPAAARMAQERDWLPRERAQPPTEEEIAAVDRVLADSMPAVHMRKPAEPKDPTGERYAGKAAALFETATGRKPGELDPATLDAARKAQHVAAPKPAPVGRVAMTPTEVAAMRKAAEVAPDPADASNVIALPTAAPANDADPPRRRAVIGANNIIDWGTE